MKRIAVLLILIWPMAVVNPGLAEEPKQATKMDQAFEKLKAMAGEWKVESKDVPGKKVTYRVVANGSVVLETLFPGTKMEMISMYHRDGDAILMTHYCAAQNQPRFRAEFDKETGDLLFVFSGGTNLDPKKDPHVHGGRVRFINANKVHSEWEFHVGGKKQGAHSLKLKRVK